MDGAEHFNNLLDTIQNYNYFYSFYQIINNLIYQNFLFNLTRGKVHGDQWIIPLINISFHNLQ